MPNTTCLNLFVYGTLMDRDELAYNLALPGSEVERRFRFRLAEAPGFRRIYNKMVPDWGGAVLNIEFQKDAEQSVVGLLILDITNQELGMLDSSMESHLPRKPLEVLVEGEKVPALAYMAKETDPAAGVSERYEARMREIVDSLGEPVRSNFEEFTFRADGAPCYREAPPPSPPAEPAPSPGNAGPGGT